MTDSAKRTKDISAKIAKYIKSYDVKPVDNYEYLINTEWLNPVDDSISLILAKKDDKSPWILTDDGWTKYECQSLGLFDEHDQLLKEFKNNVYGICHYFKPDQIKQSQYGFYMQITNLKKLNDKLNTFLQMILETFAMAKFITNFRQDQSKHMSKEV